jgi:glycosyltransferase involved in cell wall biosynthesis
MIEAMACGTPIIVYRQGAVPELMEEGRTGFIVSELEDAIAAVRRIPELSRKRCREVFEQRFTASRMAKDYVRIYRRLMEHKKQQAA